MWQICRIVKGATARGRERLTAPAAGNSARRHQRHAAARRSRPPCVHHITSGPAQGRQRVAVLAKAPAPHDRWCGPRSAQQPGSRTQPRSDNVLPSAQQPRCARCCSSRINSLEQSGHQWHRMLCGLKLRPTHAPAPSRLRPSAATRLLAFAATQPPFQPQHLPRQRRTGAHLSGI